MIPYRCVKNKIIIFFICSLCLIQLACPNNDPVNKTVKNNSPKNTGEPTNKPSIKIPTEEELLKTIKELPDNQIDIGLVSLVIAKDIYPDIDISIYIKELDAMAKELSGKIGAEKNPEKLLAIFNNYINQGEEKYIIMMRMH